jgi:hypothetical protein
MSDDKPDTATLSGAEFQRHVGTDAQKWAEAMLEATANAYTASKEERIALVARWFSDYAEVRVAEEVGRVTARLVPRHDE